MAIDKKSETQDDSQTTGMKDAGTSIKNEAASRHDRGRGNGQQGAGGLDEVGERATSDQAGSQPHLGGADVSSGGATPGTGLTENSDPMSRSGLPDLTDRQTTDHSDTRPDTDSDRDSDR